MRDPAKDSGSSPTVAAAEDLRQLLSLPPMRRRVLWVAWTLPGLLHAMQAWALADGLAPWRIAVFCLPLWWPWIPATGWVLRLAERFPLWAPGAWRATIKTCGPHLAAAVTLACGHIALYRLWYGLWISNDGFPSPLDLVTQPIFMESLSTYLLILCSRHIAGLSRRLHERELQETRILGRLAEAEIRALRMQLQPEALAASLEDLSRLVAAGDLEAAEPAIDKLAGDLRETLRHGDNLPEVWSNPDFERKPLPPSPPHLSGRSPS